MDHAAWLSKGMDGADDEARKAYKYFMRPDPKQREFVGELRTEYDEVTGKKLRHRVARVGMVRNAPVDQMREVKVYLDPLPHIRLDNAKPLQGWYMNKTSESGKNRPRPCNTEAILTEPYGGFCTVGCAFCYVNSGFRGYRGSGLVSVPLNYGAYIAKTLATMRTSAAGYFSSFTDPFLPLEEYYHNTQQGAEAFVAAGLPIFFLSRLRYPDWAVELLTQNKYSYAQKSLNTPDAEDWAKLSPGALGLDEHLDDIRRLKDRGIYVSIQCNPIVPGIVDHEDVVRLFEKLRAAGADHVIVKFVEAGYSWAPAMVERITKRFGDNRAAAFRDLFVQNIGGQRTVDEQYRMEGHRLYRAAAKRLGLTYATCYEYKYARDAAGEIINKVGVSVGSEFLTAAQCHGQRVPMFSRTDLSAPFKEEKACPPAGCLTCADKTGVAKCGSDLFGAAGALRLPDFKHAIRE